MDVFLKPYRRKIAVAATRMASRCAEPGALLLFTFIGQPRFDEIGCRARRSASPSDCPCSSSSQELRVARFGIAENVPWIIPVRAGCLVQLFEILAGELDGEGAQIVLELRLGPRAYDDAGRLRASKKPSERYSGMRSFMLFRNSADHVEQIPVLLVVQGPEIILMYVEARSRRRRSAALVFSGQKAPREGRPNENAEPKRRRGGNEFSLGRALD